MTNSADLWTTLGAGGSVGGGGLVLLLRGWIASKIKSDVKEVIEDEKVVERLDKHKEKIKDDREAFAHFQEEYHRDKKLIEDAVSSIDRLKDKVSDVKSGANMADNRIRAIEERERKQSEIMSEFASESRLLHQQVSYIETDLRDTKVVLSDMQKMMTEIRDTMMKVLVKVDK